MAEQVKNDYKRDLSLSFEEIGGFALPIAFYIILSFTLTYIFFHGFDILIWGWNVKIILIASIPVFIGGVILHELIHGLCFSWFSGKPLHFVKYGFDRKTLTPYAHCKEPISAGAYKIGAIMPAVALGFTPFLIALYNGDIYLFLFGTFFTVAACGDFIIFWLIRNLSNNILVEDHPSKAGCYIYTSDTTTINTDQNISIHKAIKLHNTYRIPFLTILALAGLVFGYRLLSLLAAVI